MKKRLLISTTAISLLTGIGMAAVQGQGMGRDQGGAGGAAPPAASGERTSPGGGPGQGGARDVTPRAGQAEQGQRAQGERGPGEKGRMGQDERRQGEPRRDMGQGEDRRNQTTGQGAAGARSAVNVKINETQRTRITQAINIRTAPRVTNVNFNVAVGTRVPRTISFLPLPATVVEVVPEYRGFLYFVVDERIIIVDPDSYQIVTIITA